MWIIEQWTDVIKLINLDDSTCRATIFVTALFIVFFVASATCSCCYEFFINFYIRPCRKSNSGRDVIKLNFHKSTFRATVFTTVRPYSIAYKSPRTFMNFCLKFRKKWADFIKLNFFNNICGVTILATAYSYCVACSFCKFKISKSVYIFLI